MPGDNFSRRVARAAAGGGAYRAQTPFAWYAILLAICLVGTGLVAYSKYELITPPAAKPAKAAEPPTKANLWEVGLQFYICNKAYNVPESTDFSQAFVTAGKGVVIIAPSQSSDPALSSGKNAILNAFLEPAGISLTAGTVSVPGAMVAPKAHHKSKGKGKGKGSTTTTTSSSTTTSSTTSTTSSTTTTSTTSVGPTTTSSGSSTTTTSTPTTSTSSTSTTTTTTLPPKVYSDGDKCGTKPADIVVEEWASPTAKKGTVITKDPQDIRFKNGQLITVAFVPKGTAIPKPASASQVSKFLLSNPQGILPSQSTQTTTATTPTTSTAGATTTAPSSSSTTTATSGATTSTTK